MYSFKWDEAVGADIIRPNSFIRQKRADNIRPYGGMMMVFIYDCIIVF